MYANPCKAWKIFNYKMIGEKKYGEKYFNLR